MSKKRSNGVIAPHADTPHADTWFDGVAAIELPGLMSPCRGKTCEQLGAESRPWARPNSGTAGIFQYSSHVLPRLMDPRAGRTLEPIAWRQRKLESRNSKPDLKSCCDSWAHRFVMESYSIHGQDVSSVDLPSTRAHRANPICWLCKIILTCF